MVASMHPQRLNTKRDIRQKLFDNEQFMLYSKIREVKSSF